jgi:macrolide transport system ATP-binding/permease protein
LAGASLSTIIHHSTFIIDMRQTLRILARDRAFSVVAVVTLAVGIGLNTTLFGIVNPLLFRPLPVHDQARLVWIASASTKPDGPQGNLTLPDLLDYRVRHEALVDAAAFGETAVALRAGDRAVRLTGQVVTANYFDLLGVRPALGRAFLPEEDSTPGGHAVLVISDSLWRRELAGDPNAVGRTIAVNGTPFTIVGVAPRGFVGVDLFAPADVWAPMSMASDVVPTVRDPTSRQSWWLHGIGRLGPTATLQSARAALGGTADAIAHAFPSSHAGVDVTLAPLKGTEPDDRSTVMTVSALLLGVTLMVLCIACANVAGLLLSRAAARQREIGIKLAIGATRGRLAAQLFLESAILATAAGALALLLSMWTTDLIVRLIELPGYVDTTVDWRVGAFTVAMSFVAALVFGLTPALRAAGQDLLPALRSQPGVDARPRSSRLQRGIVAGQLALCLVLLVCAGLFLRALSTASRMSVGFDYQDRVSVSIDLRMRQYSPTRAAAFYRELVTRVQAIPGVRAVTIAENVPMGGRVNVGGLEFPGVPADPNARSPRAAVNSVGTGYFSTLAIPILRGRDFRDADLTSRPSVAIVSETMAARHWPDRDPIGQQFSVGGISQPLTVVGVARDTLVDEFNERPWASVYVPYGGVRESLSLIAWSVMPAGDTIHRIEQVVRQIDPDMPLFKSMPLSGYIAERLDAERALSKLLGICGALALALATLGVYGVMAYTVTRRRREIGVRVALGATAGDVRRLFVGEGVRLSTIGVLAGLIPAIAASRFLASQLVGVTTFDAPTFAATAALVTAISVCAAWLPARRAARIDPMAAIRTE